MDGSTPHTAQSAYLFKIYIFQRFSGIDFVNGAQGGFHYTTCRTEDDTGTGRFSHRIVERAVQYEGKTDVGTLYQSCQFAGGDGIINVGDAVHFKFVTVTFIFLGQTGHDGDDYQFLAGDSHFLCPVRLGDGAEHLLGRTCGRRDIQHIREMMFEEIHPCRTAGSQDWKPNGFVAIQVACQSVQNLRTFFHDGQVSGKVCIKAQFAQGVNHFSGYQRAGR